MNLHKNSYFKQPELIKRIILNENQDYDLSLKKSTTYFLQYVYKNKNFTKKCLKNLRHQYFII